MQTTTRRGELEWGTLCLNYGFWQCLASPLWTVAWNCTPSVEWGAPVSVHSQLLFSLSLVCYRASSKVYLCIVCTHASCHRMRLYIYLYLCILYIYICNICRSLHVWKWTRENKTEATSHCPRQNTQKRAQQPHRECTRAHTYAQSQVFNTQVYTEVESDSQSLRGKWKGGVLERTLAPVCNSTVHWMHCRVCQRGNNVGREYTRTALSRQWLGVVWKLS